jgi:amidase
MKVDMDQIAYMSVSEMAEKIKTRQLSPVEIVEYFIRRIEKRNKSLNAFVYYGFDHAREKAREAEKALYSGE